MAVSIYSYGQELRPVIGPNQKYGYVDETGNVVIPFMYFDAGKFSEGLARVRHGKKWSFIDKTGWGVFPDEYDGAGDFSEGLARVKSNRKWGFINNKGMATIQGKIIKNFYLMYYIMDVCEQ